METRLRTQLRVHLGKCPLGAAKANDRLITPLAQFDKRKRKKKTYPNMHQEKQDVSFPKRKRFLFRKMLINHTI